MDIRRGHRTHPGLLRAQLDRIREQQWNVTWENYVHETFRSRTSPSDVRRRHLVLDLSEHEEPVPISKLRDLGPRVAAAYAKKTAKTLSRDLNALLQIGLLESTREGFRAKKEIILGFLFLRHNQGHQPKRERTDERPVRPNPTKQSRHLLATASKGTC